MEKGACCVLLVCVCAATRPASTRLVDRGEDRISKHLTKWLLLGNELLKNSWYRDGGRPAIYDYRSADGDH